MPLHFAMLMCAPRADVSVLRMLEATIRDRNLAAGPRSRRGFTAGSYALAALVRGDLQEARERLERLVADDGSCPPRFSPGMRAELAHALALEGDPHAAEAATTALADAPGMAAFEAEPLALQSLGMTALDCGDLAAAASHLQLALQRCVAMREARMLPALLLASAELAHERADRRAGTKLVSAAVGEYGRMRCPLPVPWRRRLDARDPALLQGQCSDDGASRSDIITLALSATDPRRGR